MILRLPARPWIPVIACCLAFACDSRSPAGPTTPQERTAPVTAITAERAAQEQRVRDALTQVLAEDRDAPAKLLAFFLHGDDGFLRRLSDHWDRAYAEELMFLELLNFPHTGQEWDRILDRQNWLQDHWSLIYPWKVRPLDPQGLDRLWTVDGLDARIRDLSREDSNILIPALREIRVYDQLQRIPKDRIDPLNQAMELASKTALGSTETEAAIQLLLLMEERIVFPASLNPFLWKCVREPSPALRAQALLVGPTPSSNAKDTEEESQLWHLLLVSSLKDENSRVSHAALIALGDSYIELEPEGRKELASQALRILLDVTLHESDPRLLLASITILSTQPYGDENPSEGQWWKVVSPLLRSRETAIQYALPALALHRFPEGQAARKTLVSMAGERNRSQSLEFWSRVHELELGPKDLPWLKKFLSEKRPVMRITTLAALAYATDWNLDEETSEALRRWTQENVGEANERQSRILGAYLNLMVQSRTSPQSWRPLLLTAMKSSKAQTRALAHIALAAHGWFPEDQVGKLRTSLPRANTEDRDSILLTLYLTAVQQGRIEEASHRLDQIYADEDGDTFLAIPFALEAGGMTRKQKQETARRLADRLMNHDFSLTERESKLWATLGSAWGPYIGDIDLDIEMLQEDSQAKATGWFDATKKARGLTRLKKALLR